MYTNDDFVSGNTVTPAVAQKVSLKDNNGYALQELKRIVVLTEKHNLQEKPEVLAGLLDDLSAQIKGGRYVEVLKNPVVYGSIAAVLSGVIIYKLTRKRKKR